MSKFGRTEIKAFMRGVYSSQEIEEAKDHYQLLNECGCEDESNPPLYDSYGASPGGHEHIEKGSFTPDELYQHFDVDQDGTVSVEDYADHIAYHNRNPELLAQYERNKPAAMQSARCPDSYKKSGDVMIQVPEDVIQMIKPLMQQFGVGCPHSFAQAMADVLGVAMDHDVVKPFSK